MRDIYTLALHAWRSIALKIVVLVIIFLSVPIVLYLEFQDAARERSQIVVASMHAQGALIAASLRPVLEEFSGQSPAALKEALAPFTDSELNIKLLFRPEQAGQGADKSFFYLASIPKVSAAYLDRERRQLVETGILDRVDDNCAGGQSLFRTYVNPKGRDELLTSLTQIRTAAGCWVVITSSTRTSVLRNIADQPYWKSEEIRFAAIIYLALAVFVVGLLVTIWGNLRRFTVLARKISVQPEKNGDTPEDNEDGFDRANRVPELAEVAQTFDRMVKSLRDSARTTRRAAEENAHAYKIPLGIIVQSLEPLRRGLNPDDGRALRALALIERALARLDSLMVAARNLEQETADLLLERRERVDFSALTQAAATGYGIMLAEENITLETDIDESCHVMGTTDALTTILENLLDNAASFTPAGGRIEVSLKSEGGLAALEICDNGPGVADEDLERIFDRYFSTRDEGASPEKPLPEDRDDETDSPMSASAARDEGAHFGIGLWVVRRTVEALHGTVKAANTGPSPLAASLSEQTPSAAATGLRITVTLPLA